MVGKTLSHYKIQDKLGQGGMGEVYRAADTKLRRSVALKVLPPTFAENAERMARFQREAQVLASLNHPHIGQIFGLEEDGDSGVHALVLELVEGPTLADRIRSGRIPMDEALRIATQIAHALEVAHEQGIVHRDLKPENVKLTENGQVKVLDFGLAKAMEGGTRDSGMTQSPTMSPTISPAITGAMTEANVVLGTAGYMSPEQARGQAVDKRADIWAFGVVLFEMLTARRLFTGDTVSDTLAAVLRLDPDWDSLPPETPGKVRRLLRRCLERAPDQRLRDIGDARIALQEVAAGDLEEHDVAAVPGTPATPRRSVLLGVAAAAAVVGAAIGLFVQRSMQPAEPELPLVKFRIPVPDLLTSLGAGATARQVPHPGSGPAHEPRLRRDHGRDLAGRKSDRLRERGPPLDPRSRGAGAAGARGHGGGHAPLLVAGRRVDRVRRRREAVQDPRAGRQPAHPVRAGERLQPRRGRGVDRGRPDRLHGRKRPALERVGAGRRPGHAARARPGDGDGFPQRVGAAGRKGIPSRRPPREWNLRSDRSPRGGRAQDPRLHGR
jgi:hypothetical protein